MSQNDSTLRRIADLPVPAELDLIDQAVIAGVAARGREAQSGRRATAWAGMFALLFGFSTSQFVPRPPVISSAIAPFASDNPLAPSTLLDIHP